MTTTNQKQEILRSLNHLDDVQSEKVLGFIKALLPGDRYSHRPQHCKRKALKEINQALQQTRYSF